LRVPARDGAPEHGQPRRGARVTGPLLDQREQLRVVGDAGEQAALGGPDRRAPAFDAVADCYGGPIGAVTGRS